MEGELEHDPRAGERFLASACRFLRDGGDDGLAQLLATCSARVVPSKSRGFVGEQLHLDVYVTAPREAYDLLASGDNDEWADDEGPRTIFRAMNALIPNHVSHQIHVLAELIDPDEDWRSEYGASRKPKDAPVPPSLLTGPDSDDIPF